MVLLPAFAIRVVMRLLVGGYRTDLLSGRQFDPAFERGHTRRDLPAMGSGDCKIVKVRAWDFFGVTAASTELVASDAGSSLGVGHDKMLPIRHGCQQAAVGILRQYTPRTRPLAIGRHEGLIAGSILITRSKS